MVLKHHNHVTPPRGKPCLHLCEDSRSNSRAILLNITGHVMHTLRSAESTVSSSSVWAVMLEHSQRWVDNRAWISPSTNSPIEDAHYGHVHAHTPDPQLKSFHVRRNKLPPAPHSNFVANQIYSKYRVALQPAPSAQLKRQWTLAKGRNFY